MPALSKNLKLILGEISSIILLILLAGTIAIKFQDYVLIENGLIRTVPAIISFLPVLFFYILVRLFFRIPSALLITLLSLYLLTEINHVKQALTGEPLTWTDISATSNISIIQHYASIWHLLLIPSFLGLTVLVVKLKQTHIPTIKNITVSSFLLFLLFPFVFHPYLSKINEDLAYKIQSKIADWGVRYYAWDWIHNLKHSGLPLHLIQTSRRDIPLKPNNTEMAHFSSLWKKNAPLDSRPKNIIFILCEACWFNKSFFKEAFQPFEKQLFINFRTISPAYGGGTVNSSFELLTGLPAHGALTGIIYQEYAKIMRDDAIAFPRAMKSAGYRTIAAHNFTRKFWSRHLIKPKLGFDQFYGLEDMNYDGPTWWPDDKVLFSKTLEDMKGHKEPGFYFLTTVYTHGGYPFNGDYGEGDYSKRLEKTILRISEFVDEALKIEPNTAILIIGDHKPALTKFFYEKNIFPESFFLKMGDRNEDFRFKPKLPRDIVGDVPVFFYHPDTSKAKDFATRGNLASFYCLSNLFDQIYVGVDLPAFSFLRQNNLCAQISGRDYYENARAIPDYIFSLSLIY